MKRVLYFLLILIIAFSLLSLSACDSDTDDKPEDKEDTTKEPEDTQKEDTPISLLFGDITIRIGAEYSLPSSVTLEDDELPLTYSFEGSDISVTSFTLMAKKAGKTVNVTASANGFSATFTVKTLAALVTPETEEPSDDDVAVSTSSVTVPIGTTYSLPASVTLDGKQRTLTYTKEGNGISISGYLITPLTTGSTTRVTGTADGYKVTFTVTVPTPDKGDMIIDAPASIYTNYAGKPITVTFTNPDYASDVSYTWDLNNVTIEDGKISAKGLYTLGSSETVTVTAKATHFEKTFTVKISSYIKAETVNVEPNVLTYESTVIKNGKRGGTVFIGDSYFDDEFFSDFYTNDAYGFDDKTYQLGLCSSGIEEWEIVSERLVMPLAPSEICVHIGFNDVHFRNLTSSTLPPRLMALFEKYREEIPGVQIYYFGIEPRKSDTAATYEKAIAVNNVMKQHANENDWLSYIDTPSFAYNSSSQTVNTSYYRDGAHVKLEYYTNFTNALNNARAALPLVDISDGLYIDHQLQGSNITHLGNMRFGDTVLVNDYVLEGKIKLTSITRSNPHLQIRLNANNRFLLWDKNNDGVIGIGYAEGNSSKTDYYDENATGNLDFTYATYDSANSKWIDKTSPITMSFKLVVTDKEAYLYIDGVKKATINNVTPEGLNFGALCIAAQIYDLKLTAKSANATGYSSELAALGITY